MTMVASLMTVATVVMGAPVVAVVSLVMAAVVAVVVIRATVKVVVALGAIEMVGAAVAKRWRWWSSCGGSNTRQ